MYDKYGGRRFLLTVTTQIAITALQWNGKLDPAGSSYSMMTIAVVAAYITGNVIQKKNDAVNSALLPGGDDAQPDSKPSRSVK